jgi:hypothetical protein
MNENQRAALLFSQSCNILIRALGMMSENMQRQQMGESMAYPNSAFDELAEEMGGNWNSAIDTLRGAT